MIEFTRMNDMKITPQVNQIEINPWNQRQADLAWHEKYQFQAEAQAPFAEGRHELFTNPVLSEIAEKYQKSVGQVVLRWLMQRGVVALAKSTKPERMRENVDIFYFVLDDGDMDKIEELDTKESAFFDHHDPEMVEWFVERIGLIMPIERVNGIRRFNERNINQINFAKTMREAGLSIKTLKDYVTLVFEDDPTTIPTRKDILGEAINTLNEKVKEIVDARDYLQWKIDNYDSHMIESENKLQKTNEVWAMIAWTSFILFA